ncbi:MAG: hypothetical protein SFV54_00450 [Bryobacteraceae bacterium]|nr:hypothetical protein [Bryobacteraceae bacterium]
MKPPAQSMREGGEALTAFNAAMKRVLSIPREEIQRREAEYKRQSEANPNRRGPKRRRGASGPVPDAEAQR